MTRESRVEYGNVPLELFVEGLLVEEDVGVMVVPVEAILNLLQRVDDAFEVTVSCQDHKRGVRFPWRERSHIFIEELTLSGLLRRRIIAAPFIRESA